VLEAVKVAVGVLDAVKVEEGVNDGVRVGVRDGVRVGVRVAVAPGIPPPDPGVRVTVRVGVRVGVRDGVKVTVALPVVVIKEVLLGRGVKVWLAVEVADSVEVSVLDAMTETVGVARGVRRGSTVKIRKTPSTPRVPKTTRAMTISRYKLLFSCMARLSARLFNDAIEEPVPLHYPPEYSQIG
jgi:hypothetical protein